MKQEYHFTISRTDRIYLILFVVLLLGWELVKYFMPEQLYSSGIEVNIEKADDDTESTRKERTEEKKITPEDHLHANDSKPSDEKYASYPSNPISIMEASLEQLRAIGLSGKVASNILKYKTAGGVIKNGNELMKIYGMDSVQFKSAAPFILFPEIQADTFFKKRTEFAKSNKPILQRIDLNQATPEDLQNLPGIGPVLADRIIKFRDGLGGFMKVEQMRDIYGLPPETLEKIMPYLTIMATPQPILINEIDLNNFSNPYISKKMARMIKAYKDQHGSFRNASELRKVYPPDSMWCEKVLPYLRF